MTAQSPHPPRRVLIALGGNAMTSPEGGASAEDQIAAVARAAEPIADVVAGGTEVVITHGNGPQVGNLLVKNELAASVVPPVPLDWCGAQTQGTIGAMLINALERSLAARGVVRAGGGARHPYPGRPSRTRSSRSRPSRSGATCRSRRRAS